MGTVVDRPLDVHTVRTVAWSTSSLSIGGLRLGEQVSQPLVSPLVNETLRVSELLPGNRASMQTVHDVLSNVTVAARDVAVELLPCTGGQPWRINHGGGQPLFAGHLSTGHRR